VWTERYGGDSCNVSEHETCPEGMFCSLAGICECHVGQMTSDRLFCLRYHQKLVGTSCTPHIDTCYQRAGQCCYYEPPPPRRPNYALHPVRPSVLRSPLTRTRKTVQCSNFAEWLLASEVTGRAVFREDRVSCRHKPHFLVLA